MRENKKEIDRKKKKLKKASNLWNWEALWFESSSIIDGPEIQILIYIKYLICLASEIIGEHIIRRRKKHSSNVLRWNITENFWFPQQKTYLKKDKSLISNSCSQHLLFIPVINTSFSISDRNGYLF